MNRLQIPLPSHSNQLNLERTPSEWIKLAHTHPLAGHFGTRATLERLKKFTSWPGMEKDIKQFVQSCDCQLKKSYPRTPPSIGSTNSTSFCDLIGIDFLGPFPPTTRNNRYIFFLNDLHTNSVFAFPCSSADLKTAEFFIRCWISQNDVPKRIISDHHIMFDGPSALQLWRQLGIKKITTAPYHQSTNGGTERAVGTFKDRIRAACSSAADWDLTVFNAVTAINHFPTKNSSHSPFEFKFGRPARGSFNPTQPSTTFNDSIIPPLPAPTEEEGSLRFKPGSFVKLKLDQPKHFTQPVWTGPYLVTSSSPHFATIVSPTFKLIHTHIDKLAAYNPPSAFVFGQSNSSSTPPAQLDRLYEVESILDHRIDDNGNILYLTKWAGFPIFESTYEPPQNFTKLTELHSYNRKHGLALPLSTTG